MTDKNDWEFVHSVADEAEWKPGLRKIFDYRDLGVRDGTDGDFIAHVIRRNDSKGTDGVQSWHCLLYTSPSPRDGLLSRMPSSA